MFSGERLRALCPGALEEIIAPAAEAMERLAVRYSVHTILRRAHFVAQLGHESAGFRKLVENLNYSAERIAQVWPRLAARADELAHKPEALANAAYAERLGNRDEASGDGWRYRGRGLIQITGRDNYRERGVAIGVDLVGSPARAAEPDLAVEIALSFWKAHRCNEAADADDVAAVTKAITGGHEGLADRIALTAQARRIFDEGKTDEIA